MVIVMLDDSSAQIELTVFNELFERHRDKLKEDALLIVAGKAQNDPYSGNFRVIAEELMDLEALRGRYAAHLRIAMNGKTDQVRDAKKLQELLAPYRTSGQGACPVVVEYQNGTAACRVALGESWRVKPDERLLAELAAWLTPESVQVVYGGA